MNKDEARELRIKLSERFWQMEEFFERISFDHQLMILEIKIAQLCAGSDDPKKTLKLSCFRIKEDFLEFRSHMREAGT